jgi:hypothetical protein
MPVYKPGTKCFVVSASGINILKANFGKIVSVVRYVGQRRFNNGSVGDAHYVRTEGSPVLDVEGESTDEAYIHTFFLLKVI